MTFDTDYWHSLDKKAAQALDVKPGDIGISHGAGDVLQGLNANIRKGASTIELGFTGVGKGNLGSGQTTPEMFGKDKREAIRQLQKINEVRATTHASIGISGLSGMQEEQFSDRAAESNLNELKRAIDFAADATQGGPVTVHTAEFPRDIGDKYKEHFEAYPVEEGETAKEEMVTLVDSHTGRLTGINKGLEIHEPEWEKKENEKGELQPIDYNGKFISNEETYARGVPKYDKDGKIIFKTKTWNNFVDEAKKRSEREGKEFSPAQEFYYQYQLSQLERSRPFSQSYRREYERIKERLDLLHMKKKEFEFSKAESKDKENKKKARLIEFLQENHLLESKGQAMDILYSDKKAIDLISEEIHKTELEAQSRKDGFIGHEKEIHQIHESRKRIVPTQDFALKRSAKNYARAAMYAYDREKAKGLKEDLFIAPENFLTESGTYGSHPEELKELVLESRKEMTKMLKDRNNFKESEAREIADNHIKATFDIGHAYTWKKYFKPKDKYETEDQRETRFQKWLMNQVDDLNKKGIIGHIHLSDNFGYGDEHLTPGEGSAPLKEFVKKMQEAGYEGLMIAEPGAQAEQEFHEVMTGAWAHLGTTPMYRTSRWVDIEDSYLGRTSAPYRIVGAYAPSEEYRGAEKGSPFWTGLGLE